jgi:hypothetical protein
MDGNFDRCWAFTQRWEGGATITQDPDDPGGTTKWGISGHAHPSLDIRSLTEEEAKEIARREYWEPVKCPAVSWPMDLARFDAAFNCGISAAGGFGVHWPDMLLNRVFYYLRLCRKNPVLKKYLFGWLNRCYDLWKEADSGNA